MTRHYYELDVMKATAIVTVVIIHSTSPFWLANFSVIDQLVGHTARFAVPAFLAASGFLYHSFDPIPLTVVLRRLRRILPPYVVASALAYGFGLYFPGHAATASLVKGLLFGGAFGPYYYVFLLLQFVVAAWFLSRLPPSLLWVCLLVSIITTAFAEVSARILVDPFWTLRRADTWALWFLLGWTVAAHREPVFAFAKRYRPTILSCWVVLLIASVAFFSLGARGFRTVRAAELVLIVANLIGLFTLKAGARSLSRRVLTLSDWSYAIYLFHPFFIYALQDTLEARFHLCPSCSLVIRAIAGLVGALCLTYIARRLLGPRSRDIVGA